MKNSCNNSNYSCSKLKSNKKKIENMIEYNGIDKNLPISSSIFKQLSIDKSFCIPCQKPDIERIVRLDTKIIVDDYKVIKTPKGTSLEGQILTGCKLIIYARISQLIMYVANEKEQSVHSAHFEECFCEYIVLPDKYDMLSSFKVIPYIEDVSINTSDKRCFCECMNIFLDVRVCTNCNQIKDSSCEGLCAKALGVSEKLPKEPKYFKEVIVEDELIIPECKPDIEGLVSITSDIEILSTKLICTDTKRSLEGQNLSGCKLIVEYKVKDLLIYTANKITQPVHSAHYESNIKSTFIIVPCDINEIDIQILLDECKLKVVAYIEDICATRKGYRNVNRCLVLFIDTVFRCI